VSIELSETLAVTIFKGAASLMGICIATLGILAGLLSDRKMSSEAEEGLNDESSGREMLKMRLAATILEIDARSLSSRLKLSTKLYAVSLLTSLFWLLLIEFPKCQNEIIASPILHLSAYLSMSASVVSFVLAFITMLSIIFSIPKRL